ncbi:helix-turn-helix domain-containing protein [Bradyrhizobium diazoefficiens]|uniref:helix-turn-helix transcriptional regulator n=1 Tax=Bradyrhizobium TaxID=374 RepID=UPI000456FFE0|nr:helix-turn-helix domain-containing protein [Bradyrhizobium diazoefficiens]APO53345.1 hypothetical protein BD122_23755 [Bradyrhizobium diazoefficiens]MCD9295071.1 helix-turn-helix domain-containing protein [Bradyrhizobium diazoefficiens]MCD9813331.1 helix-turn-helix domain-containing protein [Bradyrhizobium diazoefficiens]MCD9829880.1 helix-turn-helix domain-containing protein [Bradyrhizobium diazoefficiens]MCD9850140.1 helix-turn-helix domain-containing protein [Bradyrhizobium diazoefficien
MPINSKQDPAPMPQDNTTILTTDQVCQRLTISAPTLRRYAKAGHGFPPKIPLGPRRVGYLASDIENYIANRRKAALATADG